MLLLYWTDEGYSRNASFSINNAKLDISTFEYFFLEMHHCDFMIIHDQKIVKFFFYIH